MFRRRHFIQLLLFVQLHASQYGIIAADDEAIGTEDVEGNAVAPLKLAVPSASVGSDDVAAGRTASAPAESPPSIRPCCGVTGQASKSSESIGSTPTPPAAKHNGWHEYSGGMSPSGADSGKAFSGGCCSSKAKNSTVPSTVGQASKQTAMAGLKHGGHVHAMGNMSSCCGVMPMSFQASTHTVVLFKFWETVEVWQFIVTVIICFFFGVLSVFLKVIRMQLSNIASREEIDGSCTSKPKFPLRQNLIRMAASTPVYAYDYLLMLIVMTFNVYLFFAVSLGLGFGMFCFGHLLVSRQKSSRQGGVSNELSDGEVEDFHCDPACCGV